MVNSGFFPETINFYDFKLDHLNRVLVAAACVTRRDCKTH